MSCLDTASVIGWRREPAPPASIIPFMRNFVEIFGPNLELRLIRGGSLKF